MPVPSWVEMPERRPGDVAEGDWDHERYRGAVERTWRQVMRSRVAQIVIQEIGWTGRTLYIYPELDWNSPSGAVVNPRHPPAGWRRGVNGGFYGTGTGQPDDAVMEFTPYKSPRYSAARAASSENPGPTGFGDDVLMHELVHVLRCTHGRLDPSPCGYGFHSVDEFYAATVANMYASEMGNRSLQEGHVRGLVRNHQRWDGPGRSPRIEWEVDMLRRWRLQMPGVTWRLTRLPRSVCEHNPFRMYARYDPEHHPVGTPIRPRQ